MTSFTARTRQDSDSAMAAAKDAYANIVRLYTGEEYDTAFKTSVRHQDAILVPTQEQKKTLQKEYNARASEIEAIHDAFVDAITAAAAELDPKNRWLNYETRNSQTLNGSPVSHEFVTPATADENNIQGDQLRKIFEAALAKIKHKKIAQHDMGGKPITQEIKK